nr:leucine-rich repeat extensin-like protein 3 [Ipomoea batatas]
MEMNLPFLMACVMMLVAWELHWHPLSMAAAAATNHTYWVGSKYQIECTLCSSCGYSYYPYTPPKGVVGGGGYFPPPYNAFPSGPAPPPPNPIVPYFPFYFHSPPPPSSSHSLQFKNLSLLSHLIIIFLFFLI